MRYALLVSYDGTHYGGWQFQNNAVTVQQKLNEALFSVFGEEITVTASGRTDSGVHASAQICHFDAQKEIPAFKVADALNHFLPEDISVLRSALAPEGFDAIRSAKKKTYCYRLYLSRQRNPLKDRYAVQIKHSVDIDKFKKASQMFVGEKDFKAYCSSGSQVKTTVREIYSIEVKENFSKGSLDIEVFVTGNGFLYNMVRTLVGTMLYFSNGVLSKEDILRSLEEGDRNFVGKTMPAKGLTLENVDYGIEIF